jgi:hypothetical protein
MTRASRVAAALWIAWAVIVWNVVFDHVIVTAGRYYVSAAAAAAAHNHYISMDDWMRPAVGRGLWIATSAAVAILVVGALGLWRATRRPQSAA